MAHDQKDPQEPDAGVFGMDSLHRLGPQLTCADDQQFFEENPDFKCIERHGCRCDCLWPAYKL